MSLIYINPYSFAGAATDPNFANVSLLLHGDGTNGSQTILDSSSTPKTVIVVGNTQISTDQSAFSGGSSIAFDGSGDYLTLPGGSAFEFGTGDFTIEMWVRAASLSGFQVLIDGRATGSSSPSQRFTAYTNGSSLVWVLDGTDYGGGTLATNTWHFIALSRNSGSVRAFNDGTQVGSTATNTSSLGIGASRPIIGGAGDVPTALNFNGFMEEIRFTKGVGRYTGNFTSPTAPFPDS